MDGTSQDCVAAEGGSFVDALKPSISTNVENLNSAENKTNSQKDEGCAESIWSFGYSYECPNCFYYDCYNDVCECEQEAEARDLDDSVKASASSNQRPGTSKLLKQINGSNGLLIRGADLRHLPKWVNQPNYFERKFADPANYINSRGEWKREPKALKLGFEEREKMVTEGNFGMDAYNVSYSLGKHQRWQLADCFEECPEKFQHPYHNITSVFMSSNQILTPQQLYAQEFPPLINGVQSSHRIKRMIAAKPNGELFEKETKRGKAIATDLLKPVQPIPGPTRKQPKHKKAARRYRRREMLRKKVECQEPPIRLVYFVNEPRPTIKQLESEALRQKFTSLLHGKKCPQSQKHRSSLIQAEDYELEHQDLDDYDNYDEEYVQEKARGFSLADFMVESENDASSFVLYSPSKSMTPSESFEFVANRQRRDSTGASSIESYEFVN